MKTQNEPNVRYIGAKIADSLYSEIEQISKFFKGGKSEVVRRAIEEGIEKVAHEQATRLSKI